MFLSSFFLILYLIVGVTKTRADVERVVEVLCAGGGVLGIFAIVEYRTHFNIFDHLQAWLPFLTPFSSENLAIARGGEVRVFASAQHPIALGGLFAMLVPLAIYLATRRASGCGGFPRPPSSSAPSRASPGRAWSCSSAPAWSTSGSAPARRRRRGR